MTGPNKNFSSLDTDELSGGITNGFTAKTLAGVHLKTISADGTSNIDFTSNITSDFDVYYIEFVDVGGFSGTSVDVRLSVNGTFQSGASDYQRASWAVEAGGTTNSFGSTGSSEMAISGGNSEDPLSGVARFSNLADGTKKPTMRHEGSYDDGGNLVTKFEAGRYETAEAVDGIRVFLRDGTAFDTGRAHLYGVTG